MITRDWNENVNSIKAFWNWFADNCQKIENDLLELDARIRALGNFAWEIGPGITKDNLLVISPGGNIELLPFTKHIVAQAKECTGWEYYYAKQPKQWELQFNFKTGNGKQVDIDASQWRYVLLRYEDGMFEIIIEAINMDGLSDDEKLTAAEILLDGVIGEELRITAIYAIDVVTKFEDIYEGKAGSMKNLLAHIKSLM